MDYHQLVALTSYIMFSAFVICTILLVWKWRTKNVRPFLFASVSWGAFSLQNIILGTAFLINDFNYYGILTSIAHVFTVIAVLMFVVFIDNVSRESISVVKVSIVSAIGGLLLYVDVFGDYISTSIPFAAFYDLLMDFYLLFLFIFLIRSTLKAPKYLKKLAISLAVTTISLGLLTFAFSWILLGVGFFLAGIYASIMNLILVFVLVRHPEILYILPYRVHRLTAIHRKLNISIYDHQFSPSEIDEDLLAGLLSALEQTSLEVLRYGEMEEVKLSEGILIFVKTNYLTVGLITSKSSKHLRDSLKNFAIDFENRFSDLLVQNAPDLYQFEPANQLLEFYFGNIPSYQ